MADGRVRGGGILSLGGVLTEHWDVIEADLHRHYAVDILDVFRGLLSWRKLRVLIEQLPADSFTKHALAGIEFDPWSATEHLLAMLHDLVADLTWITATVNSKKKIPVPKPLPRPGDKAKTQRETPTIRPSQLKQWLATGEVTNG